jgi:GNAT superfamily N-acetyltransferase
MMDFTIRAAQLDDAETLAAFNEAMAWETEHKRLDPATIRAGVRAVLSDATKGRYFVAESMTACGVAGDQSAPGVIGQVMHTREWSDWRNGDIWWLQSVYVHPDHRGRGVFRALLQEVLSEAHSTPGIVGVRLYVERENHAARTVYSRLGFANAGYDVLEQMFSG